MRRIRHIVQSEHIIDAATSLQQAEEAFHIAPYELFIVDLEPADGDGTEFCRFIRKNRSSAAVLILTGAITIEDKVRGFTSGADAGWRFLSLSFVFPAYISTMYGASIPQSLDDLLVSHRHVWDFD